MTGDAGLTPDEESRLVRILWDGNNYAGKEQLTRPEELHQLAWNYDWDDGIDVPRWIVSHPACDAGTVLLLYWRAAPRWCCQYRSRDEVRAEERPTYDFVRDLQDLYLSGNFPAGRIVFDPTDDDGVDWTTHYADVPAAWQIPPQMYAPTRGARLRRAAV